MKALILAGGLGTRLRPITEEIPKPMVKIAGKPVLEHLIDLFRKYNITDIIISIGYLGKKIKEYFGDGYKFGVKITYIEEKERLGTAGPLLLAKDLLKETFFMSNGDELKELNLNEMLKFHRENNALATIGLTEVDNPSEYGVAILKDNKIVKFIEKPKNPPSNLINAGIYVLEPEIINYIPRRKGEIKIEKEVFPKIAEEGKLFGYKFEGQWFDIGTLERYEKAKKMWKK